MCVREVSKCLYQARTVMCMCVREVSKCLYQARTVMCMGVREVSKCLYQARTVMCMCVRGIDCVYVSTILIFDSDSVVFCDCSDSVVFLDCSDNVVFWDCSDIVIALTVWYFGIVLTGYRWYFVCIYHFISMIAATVA
jgi:hypothetical protein